MEHRVRARTRDGQARLPAAILLALLLSCVAGSAGAATVRVGDVFAQPGDTIDIPILIEDAGGPTTGFDLDAVLSFDAAVLTNFVAVLDGALGAVPNDYYFPDSLDAGAGLRSFNLSAGFTPAADPNAEVLLLRFDVAPGAAFGAYALGLSGVVLDLDPGAAAAGGTLTLVPVPGGLALLAGALPLLALRSRRGRRD